MILYSDQGSKAFPAFCEKVNVSQSMGKAGYPYDNTPMEQYFNNLKNKRINLYEDEYQTEEEFYRIVEEFAYVIYNHVRPHSFNRYRALFEAGNTE